MFRTTVAAHERGRDAALNVAFMGGSIMGLTVAAMGLLGLGALYLAFGRDPATANVIHGFGMGASVVALFSRVGGGIYTKSADVGADLVGKIEAGIPEDDPRNPGVIADNVGDNVGDVAGMGSDIFESYCGSIIATVAISATLAPAVIERLGERQALMFLPLGLASTGIICSILGILLVKIAARKSPATGASDRNLFCRSNLHCRGLLGRTWAWNRHRGVGFRAGRGSRWDHHRPGHRVLHRRNTRSKDCQRRGHGSCNRHHCGPGNRHTIRGRARTEPGRNHILCKSICGLVWGRHRRSWHAGHRRHHHGHRCLWPRGR